MTRPETLVRQLAEATLQPLAAEHQRIRNTRGAPPKVTPQVRALFRRYRAASTVCNRLQEQLKRAGANHYGSRPTMHDDGQAKAKALEVVNKQIARVKELRQTAMLAVLGLDAAKARPIVLKLKKDLEKVAK